jgi:hypothetical protein
MDNASAVFDDHTAGDSFQNNRGWNRHPGQPQRLRIQFLVFEKPPGAHPIPLATHFKKIA